MSYLRDLLRSLGCFDRQILERLPSCGCVRVKSRRGWCRRSSDVTVTAFAWSPWGELARQGRATRKASLDELESIVDDVRSSGPGLHVIGVLSTTGWESEAWSARLSDKCCSIVLIDPLPSGGWRTKHELPETAAPIRTLFEPEDAGDRDRRCLDLLLRDSDLSIPGGYREVEDLQREYGVSQDVLRTAVERARRRDVPLSWVTCDGRDLVKRDRFERSREGVIQ